MGHAATHDDNQELGYEPDVKSSEMMTVGIYFVVLASLFFATVGGLFMYFRYEADQHIQAVVGEVQSPELQQRREADKESLKTIDAAMKAVATELK